MRDIPFSAVYRYIYTHTHTCTHTLILQGWTACAMRDIPFSAIYFPVYANSKKFLLSLGNKNGQQREETLFDALVAGLMAVGISLFCGCLPYENMTVVIHSGFSWQSFCLKCQSRFPKNCHGQKDFLEILMPCSL